MARQTFDYTHGDTGVKPTVSLDFQKGERPKAEQFDWYWYNVTEAISGHAAEFDRLDSNDDGVVDEADTLTSGGNLKGDLDTIDGETLWYESGGYIPQGRLQNDSVTVAGNLVSLGGSTTIAHGDLSDRPSDAHHIRYADSEAISAINAETSLTVDISGNADTLDGQHYSDIQTWVNTNADVSNADHADSATDADGVNGFGVVTGGGDALDTPSYATMSDVPALSAGNIVYVEDENKHYFEDGT